MRPAEAPVQYASSGISDRRCVGEDFLHSRIGRKRFALHDTDRRQLSRKFCVVRVCRLLLDVGVDHLEERIVAWRNRVERFPAGLNELGWRNWWIGFEP